MNQEEGNEDLHPGTTIHTPFMPTKYTQKYHHSGLQYARPSKKVVRRYNTQP